MVIVYITLLLYTPRGSILEPDWSHDPNVYLVSGLIGQKHIFDRFLKNPMAFRKMTDKSSTEGSALEGVDAVGDDVKLENTALKNLPQNADTANNDVNFEDVPLEEEKNSEMTSL